MSRVKVRVPATTANIGPGFDCLGCALSLYAEFTCEEIPTGLEVTGCAEKYRNGNNLFVCAFRRAEKQMGVPSMPFRVHIETNVPVSRGLGSSATLIAAGVAAADALHGGRMTVDEKVELCNELEGHPDNIAPAVLGGMCVSMVKNGRPITEKIPVAKNVGFIAMIPNFETKTSAMRAVLPREVPFADAVFNASRLAVLLRAFEKGDMQRIGQALEDRLHQPYRKDLIHEYALAEKTALDCGCRAFCISGSGSTCLGICEVKDMEAVARRIQEALADSPYQWRALALNVDAEGAACTFD